ncbi:MBL fold metallo-hydrolase [Megamonas funiformis]
MQTSDGIILIDSIWDNNDAQLIIDDILISHGHGDHYGGAQY